MPFVVEGTVGRGQPEPVSRYHRSLSWYTQELISAGLVIDSLDEPMPDETFKAERPEQFERMEPVPFNLVPGARKST